ncbi:MAG TPA: CPBP family intramembrane glutamic endopeptidase [Caulobacteraceae bacterium]|nr:CPBP family intramembrane glutamic endopeptidase [Caulobacteraceae bacterium]
MSLGAPRLSQSAFIADLSGRERSFLRVLATVVAGGLGGVIVGLTCGIAALLAFAAATGALSGGVGGLPQHVTALVGANGASVQSALVLLTLATATNAPWAATFIAMAALIGGRRPLGYVTVAPRIRWGLLGTGLAMSFAIIGPLVAAGQLLDPHATPAPVLSLSKDWPTRLGYAAACVALLIPAAAAEEVVFRGWLLRESAALSRNPIFLMAVNGVLFSAVHGEFAPDAFLTRALMGAGFVYMTLRLGGIEFSTGAHAANNILIVLFIQPLSLKPAATGGLTADAMFQDAFLFASYVIMAEIVARWPPLRRLTGADAAEIVPIERTAQTLS